MKKKIKATYVPVVKSLGDVSNFDEYPDSGSVAQDIKSSLDPFLGWWFNEYLVETNNKYHFKSKWSYEWIYFQNFLSGLINFYKFMSFIWRSKIKIKI